MIKQAPLMFFIVWALGAVVTYIGVRRSLRGQLDDLRKTIADRDSVIAFLEKKQCLTDNTAAPMHEKKKELSPPVIELAHFDFEDVVQDENGIYFKVAKGQGFKAAILDFSLKPISGAVPWTEVQPQIRFKNAEGRVIRVRDAIWLGEDKPKVPFRYGMTHSLVLATRAPKRDFRTYERESHATKPLERPLVGEAIRAEVRLIGEYMDDPKADASWYFQLIKEDTPRIVEITGEQFNTT